MAQKIYIFLTTILLFLITVSAIAKEKQPTPELERWIKNLMQEYNIPGVSIAVIKDYKVEWAQGFGLRDKENNLPVTTDTLFQAASISKPLTAVAALETFANQHLSIKTDINQILSSWKIPASPYTRKKPITLQLLLSHTAGITGFRETGYTTQDKLPTLLEILNGQTPANTPPIVSIRKPNTKFEYSPASYTIVQAVLTDIYHQPFDTIMQDLILGPLRMKQSTFTTPLPESEYKHIAWPYLPDGTLVPNSPYSFPTAASGGLWSTPTDLTKFVIAIQKALSGRTQGKITPQLVKSMMAPGLNHNMGMGFEVNINKFGEATNKPGDYFRHGGFQTGYLSMLVGSKQGGNGIVIMYNSAPYMTAKEVKQYEFLTKTIKHISQIEGWK